MKLGECLQYICTRLQISAVLHAFHTKHAYNMYVHYMSKQYLIYRITNVFVCVQNVCLQYNPTCHVMDYSEHTFRQGFLSSMLMTAFYLIVS